jgi:hypothetical protein
MMEEVKMRGRENGKEGTRGVTWLADLLCKQL